MKASAAADVLDNSNGWVGELSVFHKMQIGRLSLTPALGVLYYDENFSDYYYGISESESRRSGLASYSAQDAWVPYVSLTAKYPIGEHVVLMASAGYSELPEEITNSPMIDRNESFTFVTGVSWRFSFTGGCRCGWCSVVMPQRLLLWIALFIPGTWRLNQDLMAEQSLAFKCRKWRIGGQQQVMQ